MRIIIILYEDQHNSDSLSGHNTSTVFCIIKVA